MKWQSYVPRVMDKESGSRRAIVAIAIVTMLLLITYHYRYRIESLYYEHFWDALPGTWMIIGLVALIVLLAIADLFVKSYRIESLEVALFMVLSFATIGAFVGYVFGFFWQVDEYPLWQHTMLVMLGIGAFAALICLFVPDHDPKDIEGMYQVNEYRFPRVYDAMKDLCDNAGCEMPPVFVSDKNIVNAHTTGKYRSRQYIVVYKPLLDILDDDELKGVLGHELSHMLHHDIVIQSISSACADVLLIFARVMGLVTFISGAMIGAASIGSSKNTTGAGCLAYFLLLIFLVPIFIVGAVLCISVPLAAITMVPCMSRKREFGADEGAARLTGDPLALARALIDMECAIQSMPVVLKQNARTSMMIVNPFIGVKRKLMYRLLPNHPSTEDRVKRLKELDRKMNGSE